MQNEGVSIIITAYHTEKFIEECLDSVASQTWFKNNDSWEIILGIDHCEATLEKVKEIMPKYRNLRVFYNTENVGTYITSNTLIDKAKYARILRFDSDDIMKDDMVEKMMLSMSTVSGCKIVKCYYKNFPAQEKKRGIDVAHGVFLCRKSIFIKYGGFMPWKCAADTEFHTRLHNEKILVITYPIILFYRRLHETSLTKSEKTNMQSEIRKEYKKYIDNESLLHPVIKTTITDTVEITFKEKSQIIEQVKTEEIKEEQKVFPLVLNNKPVHVKKTTPNVVRKRVKSNAYIGT